MTAPDSPASSALQSPPHPYYNQAVHGPYELADIGDFVTESGATLRGVQLAYVTHGTLNPGKTNAILMTTWYSGTSKIMEQIFVGPGRALDPEKYFIVIVNQLSSGLGTSPHNTPLPWDGPNFPQLSIADDVRAQHALLTQKWGLSELALVVGGSMGAQQTYEWAVRYPEKVLRAAPLAGTARIYEHCRIFGQTLVDALVSDPGYADGYPERSSDVRQGLERHARLFALHVLSNDFWTDEHWRALGFSSADDFATGFLGGYFEPMDASDLVAQSWKWQHGDVSRHTGGDLAAALGRITARTTVMPISTDQFFPVPDCAAEQALVPGSTLQVIEDVHGHAALFGLSGPAYAEQVDAALSALLAS